MIIGIDVETANSQAGAICAIGVAVVTHGVVVRDRHWLLNPQSAFDPRFTGIHGITERDVRGKPSIKSAWNEVLAFITQARMECSPPRLFAFDPTEEPTARFVAHNAPFDRGQLEAALGSALPFHLECTVRLARKSFPQLPKHTLNVVSAHLQIPLRHHDALSDARACALIASKCQNS